MIGIFDSGLGGLTVARAITDLNPLFDIIYFGDTARTPYGSKSQKTVIQYAIENTEFLLNKGASYIVVACNSASSAAIEILRKKFSIPIFEVISPAVEMTLSDPDTKKVGVIGTRATINSKIYDAMIKAVRPDIKVYSNPCPLLVPLVEEGWLKRPETKMIVKKYLHPLKAFQIDTLILACTHYPIIKKLISKKAGKRVRIIDSAQSVANQLRQYFHLNKISSPNSAINKQGVCEFYVSDITPHFEKIAKSIFNRHVKLQCSS